MKKIENPKVFISYAWGTKEYEDKVLSLANSLISDGVDVIFDKWELKEGNDTYFFMEKTATDETVTNVILLLDPVYAQKANDRKGGVGTETQIISSEIYNKVNQEKFLPIIFERNETGEICKPQYLKSLLHFDLSKEELFTIEYQRLVRRLFGVEVFAKPQIGNKPNWVDTIEVLPIKNYIEINSILNHSNLETQKQALNNFLDTLAKEFVDFDIKDIDIENFEKEFQNYINKYQEIQKLRDKYLEVLKIAISIEKSEIFIADFLEKLHNSFRRNNEKYIEIKRLIIHEMFIYTIAVFLKKSLFDKVGYFMSKTYFGGKYGDGEAAGYEMFYSFDFKLLNYCVNNRDNINYHTGTGQLWMDTMNTNLCDKRDFVFADNLCYNFGLFGNREKQKWIWFPLTYIYGTNYEDNILKSFALKLKSKERLQQAIKIFDFSTIELFIVKFQEIENKITNQEYRDYSFPECFENAPNLVEYIKSKELGSLK